MRELFAVLEQQRVTKNAQEMGAPSEERMNALLAKANEDEKEGKSVKSKTPREMMMEAAQFKN